MAKHVDDKVDKDQSSERWRDPAAERFFSPEMGAAYLLALENILFPGEVVMPSQVLLPPEEYILMGYAN